MLQLALRTLRFRTGTFLAAFLAILGAATILMACGGLIETGLRTAVPPAQLASADVVVAGEQAYDATGGDPDEPAILPERVRVDADLEQTIAALPGVQDVTTYVFEGQPPTGTVDALGVVAEPGADVDALRERIDDGLDEQTTTLVGDERGRAELREAQATGVTVIALAGVFTAFAILVSIFGVASMLALSIQQRRQELALLRAVGATPRQVRRLISRETLALAVVAAGLAVLPGQLLGRLLFDLLVGRGIATDGVTFHQGWIPTVAALAVAVVAALAGARGAGRRAARIRPTQALTEVSVEGRVIGPVRLLLGAILLAGGAALMVVTIGVLDGPTAQATAAPAVIILTVGFAVLAPVLTKLMTLALQLPVQALGGVTGQLAALNARGRSGRLAAVVAPVILLTGVATGMLYLQTTSDAADRQAYSDSLVADAVLTTDGPLDPSLVEDVAALPGVDGASADIRSTGFIEEPEDRSPAGEGWTLQGVSATGAEATTAADVTAGSLTGLVGDTVALGDEHAGELGVDVGDTIALRMGDNTVEELEVTALFTADEDDGTLLLPVDTLAAHTTGGTAGRILVTAADGTTPAELVSGLTQATAERPGTVVTDRSALFEAYDDGRSTATFAIYIMVMMIAGYAAITVVNTLASSTAARRREFGLQRLAGSTRGQVLRMVGTESAMVSVSGVLLGTAAALVVLVPVSLQRLGSPVPAGSPLVYLTIVGLTVLLTLAATLLPAWRATRGRPAESALAVE